MSKEEARAYIANLFGEGVQEFSIAPIGESGFYKATLSREIDPMQGGKLFAALAAITNEEKVTA